MNLQYNTKKLQKQCTNFKIAKKEFDAKTAEKLFATIEFIKQAKNLGDIIAMKTYNFHHLNQNKKIKTKHQYAIDIDGRRSSYRLIITPLDCDENIVDSRDLKELCKCTDILLVLEVSKHYE